MKAISIFFISVLFCLSSTITFSQYVGQFSSNQTIKSHVPIKAYSFDLKDVRLSG